MRKIALIVWLLAGPELALAALSEYRASAELSYALTAIEGGDPSGLSAVLRFEPLYSHVYLEGDGTVRADNPSVSVSLGLGEPVLHTFAASGEVNDGRVDARHAGRYVLDLANSSSEVYTVELAWSYRLSAQALAQGASSASSIVSLDYWQENYSFFDYDLVFADVIQAEAVREGGKPLAFTLPPGANLAFYASLVIESNLEAMPVPVPAALWLFGGVLLGWAGLRHRCGISRAVWE